MWGSLATTDSSSSRESSSSSDDACSVASFAENDTRIRSTYCSVINSNVNSLNLFVSDHMARASNRASAATIVDLGNRSSSRSGSGDLPAEGAAATQEQQQPPRWRTLSNEIIQVINSVSSVRQRLPASVHLPTNVQRKLANLDASDIGVVLRMCFRTLTMLCVAAGAFSYFGEAAAANQEENDDGEGEGENDAARENEDKDDKKPNRKRSKKPEKLWFDMVGNRAKRKRKKLNQVQLLVHIARCIDDPEAEEDSDFPFCADEADGLLMVISESGEQRELVNRALRATSSLEALFERPAAAAAAAASENNSSSVTNNGVKSSSSSPNRRRVRPYEDENEEDEAERAARGGGAAGGGRRPPPPPFVDEFGTTWTDELRRGCSLLGGVAHHVRGAQLQMQFDINRARDEFSLPPQAMCNSGDPKGWISRFDPIADKFPVDAEGDVVLWMNLSKELKRVGIKERMIEKKIEEEKREEESTSFIHHYHHHPQMPMQLSNSNNNTNNTNSSILAVDQILSQQHIPEVDASQKLNDTMEINNNDDDECGDAAQQQQQQLMRFATPAPSSGGGGGGGGVSTGGGVGATSINDADGGDDVEMQEKHRRKVGKNPFKHADEEGRAQFAVSRSNQQPLLLPSAFSRAVADRAMARNEVHNSFQRIQSLTEELRTQVSHFSACAEAANILEAVTPTMIDGAEKELRTVRRVSEFLLAVCALATAAPRVVVEMSNAEFTDRVAAYLAV